MLFPIQNGSGSFAFLLKTGDHMTATINSRTTIHRGRVFELVTENVTLRNGVTTNMEYIEHPGATGIVALSDRKHVILIRQYRHTLREDIWEIPAGTLDPRESASACAQRELIEETGFSAGRWHSLGAITPVPGYSDERVHLFVAQNLQPAARNLDEDEIIRVHQIEFEEALGMIRRGEIKDAKTIAGLYLASEWLQANGNH